MLYSRRCLEVIITNLCECELKRPRKTEPLKGIIDKLNREEKVPSHIITSMHSLNSLSTYGAHPKDFDPEQVKPVLSNLAIIIKWYLRYKGIEIPDIAIAEEEKDEIIGIGKQAIDISKLEKSIALLPFKNDSPDEENTYFINGLMEEVLNNLQKIKDLRVISRTSVEQYRNQTKPIPEIAKELGVNYIVEGSGQKYGNAFRLRIQLIMAAKESHLWGESYQQKISDVEDIFMMQSQIAETIAKELKAVITPQEKGLIKKIPTTELAAYDAYLKGQYYWRKLTPNDLETAMNYFEMAKEKDPKYALAYAGISDVWIGRQQMGIASPAEAGPKAVEAAMKSLELDNTRAEVYYTLATMKTWGMWDWTGGESAFKKAMELNPNHAEANAFYAHLMNILGRPEEALEYGKVSLKLDPHNPLLKSLYSADLIFSRRYNEAIIAARDALKMDPTAPVALTMLAIALYMTEKYEESLEPVKKIWVSLYGNSEFGQVLDKNYAEKGYSVALNQGADLLLLQSEKTYINPFEITLLYLMAGNKEKSLKCIEKAYELRDPNLPYLHFPIYDSLRDEPRFQDIARKMNLSYK
jgi:TolB-like protein/cytochrome c-type biogenesis protein CcmH/NrfG